ncbi:la-related protein 6B-like [Aristolochia californica]|uniref:la-related protein 6B-like n=1 Tax=Aristolochia californica TaxID=171875 RepID=UPI0035DA0BF7
MAQESIHETLETSIEAEDRDSGDRLPADATLGRNVSFSRLNARAPEFIPRTVNRPDQSSPRVVLAQSPAPVHVFPSPSSHFQVVSPQNPGSFQYYVGYADRDGVPIVPDQESAPARDGLSEEVLHKVVNQVEYYFSDVNLATTDHLMRFINKDLEGFVPISVVAAFKKIKALVSSNSLLADALRTSSKLVVSEDGKKVRRQHPFSNADVDELQARIIVAENLPEDHSHQKLMKIFSSVGSVKSIRSCPAQPSNGAASAASRSGKMEMFFSHKLHAFVEYETIELAEKAAADLNDEKNWRSGLRVRLLNKCMAKFARGRRGHDGDWNGEEEDVCTSEQYNEKQTEDPQASELSPDHVGEESIQDKEAGGRRGRGRGRGKGRGRGQYHNGRGGHTVGTPPSSNLFQNDQPTASKQPPGPRMPDGTRGFTLGRGKPFSAST